MIKYTFVCGFEDQLNVLYNLTNTLCSIVSVCNKAISYLGTCTCKHEPSLTHVMITKHIASLKLYLLSKRLLATTNSLLYICFGAKNKLITYNVLAKFLADTNQR